MPWREVFVGGGVAAVAAAVGPAGRGRAGARMLPFGAVDVGPRLRLPEMPRLPVLPAHARQGRPPQQALAALSAAFQGAIRG